MSNLPIKLLPIFINNIEALANKLMAKPELFNKYKQRRLAPETVAHLLSPHRECSDIWVRYGDIDTIGPSVFIDKHESVWYDVIVDLPEVVDIANYLMLQLGGLQLGGILITKLEPTKKIYQHTDTIGWHPNYYEKFYIPIQTSDGASFDFEDVSISSIPGEVYWFRNDVPHAITNDSHEDRLSLIITLKPKNMEFLNV